MVFMNKYIYLKRETGVLFLLLISSLLFSFAARADLRCEAEGATTVADIGNTDAITVSRSTPIGTVIFSKTMTGLKVKCTSSALTKSDNLYFVRKNLKNILGAGSGLSMFVTYKGNRGDTPVNILQASDVGYFGPPGTSFNWPEFNLSDVTVEIVKTGEMMDKVSVPSNLITVFQLDSSPSGGNPASFFVKNAPNINFVTETCRPLNQSVEVLIPPEPIKPGGFGSGPGTTSVSNKPFNLEFFCDVSVSGKFDVSLQIDGVSATADPAQGVLKLDETGPGKATGAGVQVLHGDTNLPVKLGTPWKIASYPNAADCRLTVPLIARYYQTEGTATGGKVHSTATFTLTYE